MKLCHRMEKSFCEVLSMSDKLDFPQLSDQSSGVRVSLRRSNGAGQPEGFIVSAATSLWLPLSKENLFNFFKDENKRAEVYYILMPLYEIYVERLMHLLCSGMCYRVGILCMPLLASQPGQIPEIASPSSRLYSISFQHLMIHSRLSYTNIYV